MADWCFVWCGCYAVPRPDDGSDAHTMSEIQAFTEEHVDGVASLYMRIRGQKQPPNAALRQYFLDLFLSNPWASAEMPTLVCVEKGKVVGALASCPGPWCSALNLSPPPSCRPSLPTRIVKGNPLALDYWRRPSTVRRNYRGLMALPDSSRPAGLLLELTPPICMRSTGSNSPAFRNRTNRPGPHWPRRPVAKADFRGRDRAARSASLHAAFASFASSGFAVSIESGVRR